MKQLILFLIPIILFVACGSDNQYEQLRKLEERRDELNRQIEQLQAEIDGNMDTIKNNLVNVDIRQVKPQLFKHYIKVQGIIESDNNILIPAQASGLVKKIYVQQGMAVKKGKILAELDGAILENTIAELEVNLELAKTMYERQKRLWDKKIGSEMQFLQAKTNKEALEKRLDAIREQYRLTKIIAPINGSVDEILIKEGEAVGAGYGTIRVVQLSALKITADLSDEYTGQIKTGDSVSIQIPIINRQLTSSIRAVSKVINPKNRTFPIEVSLSADIRDIQPNMLVVLTINNYSNPDALTVPVNIVQKTGISKFLFTVSGDTGNVKNHWKVQRRTVETGKTYGDMVEVISGLKADEYVVIRGFQNLADHQTVLATLNDK